MELFGIQADRIVNIPWELMFFVVCTIIISGYIFRNLYAFKAKKINTIKEGSDISHKQKLKDYFDKLGEENKTLTSRIFFKKYNIGIRQVFVMQGLINAHKITLKELKKQENISKNPVFSIFKKSYIYEYSPENIPPETRKKYIVDILIQLKK